ncbi:hypothetical protein BGZ80_004442 [Entomortierella chlamydospora]|uniref:Pentatricopeptide repeat protein n=1 Tax=Entomortierella chlamydospora TaxID=101097 RepID=A0A9P6MM93_9FUNG|nr:hypothetical protein BGZ80_004442 [Entomortierella chlamydospora]
MRSSAIRCMLAGPQLSVAFRTEQQLLQARAADNFWKQCFKRAYSRSMFSKDRQLITTFCPTHSSEKRIPSPCLATGKHHPPRSRHSRPYTNAATATVTFSRPGAKPITNGSTLAPVANPTPTPVSSTESRSAEVIMKRLDQALRDQDLKTAYAEYLIMRQRTFPTDLTHLWYRCQRRLVQLFHRTRLEVLSNDHAHLFTRKLKQLDHNRRVVLRDIHQRTLKTSKQAETIAKLVNALGKSKAMVQHSYLTDSKTKLDDWREALRVLEDWTALKPHGVSTPASGLSSDAEGEADESSTAATDATAGSPSSYQLENKIMEKDLATWLSKLMRRLVYSHTFLVRSMLDTIPSQYGIQTTTEMYIALLEYYAMFGKDGCKDTLDIIHKMGSQGIDWRQEPVIYDYILYALSHESGNVAQADKVIEKMLASDLVPREETMKAAILCAARSGDLEACSRYIQRMHHDWNLSITERMKAIMLYACAKRGDFEGTLEILGQLSRSGKLVEPKVDIPRTHRRSRDTDSITSTSASALSPKDTIEKSLDAQDIINNSNVLLTLINQTHSRRGGKKQLSQEFVKDEVSKVLELFTVITRDQDRVDTQFYTIMMHYLSSLPSPLPGMMYLYKEMQASENAKPDNVTYKIMMEACAEQMDMDQGRRLWGDLKGAKVIQDCHIRASYVKGWGRTGHLDTAEAIARAGLLAQEQLEKDRFQNQIVFAIRNKKRRSLGLPELEKPPRLPKRQRTGEMINLTVLHELMKAHRQHNNPARVYELYREIESGKWGRKIRPNGFTLSIVLGACASGTATVELVDRSIELVDHVLEIKRRQRQQYYKGSDVEDADEGRDNDDDNNGDEAYPDGRHYRRRIHDLLGSESVPDKSQLPILSDVNYQLYFTMLGRHHRQHKIVEVWDDMMDSIENPPSHLTVNLVTEALENVQWGARPIKQILRQLRERWPEIDWTKVDWGTRSGPRSYRVEVDDSVGAGGRFWK